MAPKNDPSKDYEIKDLNDLSALVLQLMDKVDKLTASFNNSTTENDLTILDNTVNVMSNKVDELSEKFDGIFLKVDENKTALTQNIEAVRVHVTDILTKSNEDSSKISVMEKRIILLERRLNTDMQRARDNNIEFQGISDNVVDENLEGTVISILEVMGINIIEGDIQGCHRLPKRKGNLYNPVITKFMNRKIPIDIMKLKTRLSSIDFERINLPCDSNIYVNLNLSPPFSELDYFARKLKKEGKVQIVNTSNSYVQLKLLNGSYSKITHINDLKVLFPDIVFESRSNMSH